MSNSIQQLLIPKRKASHSVKTGRTIDFRNKFWQEFNNVKIYESRVQALKQNLSLIDNFSTEQQIYFEANIDFESVNESKGATPEQIWNISGIDVVSSSIESKVIISGKRADYQKLRQILDSASFSVAKSGGVHITARQKNAFREVFSISSIVDNNTKVEGRVDRQIEELIALKESRKIDCVVEFRSDVNRWSYDEKLEKLRDLLRREIIPASPEIVIHNMFCFINLTMDEVVSILSDQTFSFIQFIRAKDKLCAQRLIPNLDLSSIKLNSPETDEIIGIIDSGVGEKILQKLKFDEIKLIPNNKIDHKSHGTFVVSRVLFGDNIFAQFQTKEITPLCKYLDIQVLYDSDDDVTECDEASLMESIDEAFRRYSNVTLYNLSINIKTGILKSEFNKKIHPLTEFIDTKAREYDKLPIVSVGNQIWYQSYVYDEVFKQENHDLFISVPSDSINSLSVGSLTNCGSTDFHCKIENYPSPFTRKGGIRTRWKKPELAHFGGNILLPGTFSYSNESYLIAAKNQGGVEGVLPGKLGKSYGTSYSTPLVSREGILALSEINRYSSTDFLDLSGNKANLVKASLIHSTAFTEQQVYTDFDHKLCTGFGIPSSERVFTDNVDKGTIMYADKIDFSSKKHEIVFELPEMIINSNCRFTFTLVYNPPVNKNFPKQYNQIYLSASPSFAFPYMKEDGKLAFKKKYIKKGKWNWDNYGNKDFSSIHFTSKKKVTSKYLTILVQMFARLQYEKEMINRLDEIEQNYAFFLTIEDLENRGQLKEQLIISDQFNQIEVEEQVEIG